MDGLGLTLLRAGRLILAGDRELFQIVGFTLAVGGGATFLGLLAAVPAGVAGALGPPPLRRWLRIGAAGVASLPTVVVGLAIWLVLAPAGSLLPLLARGPAILAANLLIIGPFLIASTIAAVEALDPALRETAWSLGAGRVRTGRLLAAQSARPIAVASALGLRRLLGEVGAAILLGGHIRQFTRTLAGTIAIDGGRGELELAIAAALVLAAMTVLLTAVAALLGGRPAELLA